jgi:hypothetical protein
VRTPPSCTSPHPRIRLRASVRRYRATMVTMIGRAFSPVRRAARYLPLGTKLAAVFVTTTAQQSLALQSFGNHVANEKSRLRISALHEVENFFFYGICRQNFHKLPMHNDMHISPSHERSLIPLQPQCIRYIPPIDHYH